MLEAIDDGIHVNAVGSGDAITNIVDHIRADGHKYPAENGKGARIKRAADPRKIAEVIAFLASDQASYIVSAVVMADDGMSIAIK